jgi:ABC-2 type transport system ATP-binding protein
VAQDTLSGLLSRIPARARMTLELDAGCDVENLRATAGVLEVTQRTAEPAHAVLEILLADLNQALAAALAALAAQGRSVRRLQSERASLEDVFLALTGRQLRD